MHACGMTESATLSQAGSNHPPGRPRMSRAQLSETRGKEHFIFPNRRFCRPRPCKPAELLGFCVATGPVGFVACVALNAEEAA
jgi:hypothetical protein